MLAPQRSLIATDEGNKLWLRQRRKQVYPHSASIWLPLVVRLAAHGLESSDGRLPQMSNFYCLPGRAEGTPVGLGKANALQVVLHIVVLRGRIAVVSIPVRFILAAESPAGQTKLSA